MSRWIRGVVLVVGATLVSSCVTPTSPARTQEAYEEKAANTAEATLSATETGRYVAEGVADGDFFATTAARMASESEDAATGAQASFDRLQPPNGGQALQLRDALDELLTRAVDELTSLRIEARQGRIEDPAAHARRLTRISHDLRTFAEAHQ